MKRIYLLVLLITISLTSNVFAQITRERADEIIFQYVIDEKIRQDVLLIEAINNLPNAEGISTITTSVPGGDYETFSIEYPCWGYHIYEWRDVNCCLPHRYLFVNKATGNVLGMKTKGSPYAPDPMSWQVIYPAFSGLPDINSKSEEWYFTNPVNDFLEITCKKDFEHIVIFDLQGKQVFQGAFKQHESIQKFNISSLHQGYYIVKIFDATKNIVGLKILKK